MSLHKTPAKPVPQAQVIQQLRELLHLERLKKNQVALSLNLMAAQPIVTICTGPQDYQTIWWVPVIRKPSTN